MNKRSVAYIFFFVIALLGCNKKRPVACFVIPKGPHEINKPITFKDCSELAESYNYEFGDGASSDEPNPTHAYTSESTFKITLKVTGEKGEDELTRHINLAK